MFPEAASGIINYDRVASYKKIIDIKFLASEDEVENFYHCLDYDLRRDSPQPHNLAE